MKTFDELTVSPQLQGLFRHARPFSPAGTKMAFGQDAAGVYYMATLHLGEVRFFRQEKRSYDECGEPLEEEPRGVAWDTI